MNNVSLVDSLYTAVGHPPLLEVCIIHTIFQKPTPLLSSGFTGCLRSPHTHNLFLSIGLHFVTWHDFIQLGNPLWQWTYDQATLHPHPRSHFLIATWALCIVDSSRQYSTQKHLVASVWVHKKSVQVKWWVTWWHCFSSDLESQLCAEHLINCAKSKTLHIVMWQILLRVVDQYPEQTSPWVSLLNLFYVPNTPSSLLRLSLGSINISHSASVVTTLVHINWTVNAPNYPNSSNNLLIHVKGTVFAGMSWSCHVMD
jgi:hypothetical protein